MGYPAWWENMGYWPIEHGRTAGKIWFDPELGAAVELRMDQVLFQRMSTPSEQGTGEQSRKVTLKLVELGKALR